MKSKISMLAGIAMAVVLTSCSNAEQKAEAPAQPSTSPSTATPAASSSASSSASTATSSAKNENDGGVYLGTINGVISDSMCGKDHSKMGGTGTDPAACVAKCVGSGAKYVLVDDKGDSYALSDQEKPKELAGKTVAITGHIDPAEKSIHVHELAAK